MITQIGIAAGEIWHYLDENGTVPLDTLVLSLGKSRELILMSVGWLAREGHVTLGAADKGYPVSLSSPRSSVS